MIRRLAAILLLGLVLVLPVRGQGIRGLEMQSINLASEIVGSELVTWTQGGRVYGRYTVPDQLVGWHGAEPGAGQTILNGHTPGVFTGLSRIRIGEDILLQWDDTVHEYTVTRKLVLRASDAATYMDLLQSQDNRLMIITCYGKHNRLVVLANYN